MDYSQPRSVEDANSVGSYTYTTYAHSKAQLNA